ncbi:helix-turn-helix transcriptional regulator [Actinocrinis puniceicyclus]|uniref:Helix-turn-helix transcriptional regulator n=1 Tax=Actinocrinis puniceicyclus TaxID=977794 RepID=A0A8J8BCR3_9ACTN|nr:helix-turn-helix transcriptional regulator [Actinocrinis puniceicyclus]MBS2963775.1 helix-turn-helix transcriptional regulator [Actinocrinis puniceicyclus]
MLEALGVSLDAENVYKTMLAEPHIGVSALAERLGFSTERVRRGLDELARLSLLRPSDENPGMLRLVSPEVGLSSLLAQREAAVLEQQRQIAASRAAVAAVVANYANLHPSRQHSDIEQLAGVDAVRSWLEERAHAGLTEVMGFNTGGAQSEASMEASRPLDQEALDRGTIMRTIYLDSARNDPPTLNYLRWLAEAGGQVRTAPTLPLRMVIFDRKQALIPTNPEHSKAGAVVQRGPGMVAALCALFEQIWHTAKPVGEERHRDGQGLTGQEQAVLSLLAEGWTDDVIARKLGVSVRTSRRVTAELTARLGARSRFQAGARAVERGWIKAV